MPLYGKIPLKSSSQELESSLLGTWYVALGMWGLPSLFNDDPGLTFCTSRSNLLPNAFKLKIF